MAIQNRVNNSGAGGQGVTLTVLAGTMILDYPNPPPNGDSTAGGQKLDQLTPLTLGGGTCSADSMPLPAALKLFQAQLSNPVEATSG